ncbi:S-adenosyl-L-methionine-dependent methyltransferase [Russula brevipes]|nr:S-adenosyl-L-methionine-dependent methyltransferase [Russula brevipes]
MPRSMRAAQLVTTLAGHIGRDNARLELKWLMEAIHSANDTPHPLPSLSKWLSRRVRGEPIQYILGTQPFGHLDVLTRPPVLIPRPETEHWTLRLAHSVTPSPHKPAHVLDLCTGSGCIPLLLCATWIPGSAAVLGIDTSLEALQLAQDNALAHPSVVELAFPHHPLTHLSPRPRPSPSSSAPPPATATSTTTTTTKNVFTLLRADVRDTPKLIETLSSWPPFDIITANPPYIPRDQYAKLDKSVRAFEDPAALLGDPPGVPDSGGLTFYFDIARLVAQGGVLAADGWLALEVGEGQARAVENIVHSVARLKDTEIWTDQWGKERVVVARYRE